MELFVIRSDDPLDHEGSPDVTAIFKNEDAAKEAVRLLNKAAEESLRPRWGDRWRSFAPYYEVESWITSADPEAVLRKHYPNA